MLDQPCKSYRDIGRSLAAYVVAKPDLCRDPTVLAALVSDFAESSLDQVAPLRDLMSRPGFQKLIPLVRTNSGALQRDALTEELRPIYSESVIKGIRELLNEFLDLPDVAIDEPSKIIHPGSNHSAQVVLSTKSSDDGTHSTSLPGSYLIKAGLSLAGLVLVAAVIQSPPLCSLVGLCSNKTLSDPLPREEPLDQAQKSARNVRAAKERDEIEKALSQLDGDLRRVDPSTLSQEQLSRFEEFKKLAADSRIPDERDSAERNHLEPAALPKQKAVVVPQPGPIDPVTTMPPAALKPASPAQQLPPVEQFQPQSVPPKPVIQQLPAPPPKQAAQPSSPALVPANPPVTRGETQGQKRYSLPPSWEERRARRREIMNHYSGEGDNSE
jgi:hypothetical protein